MPVTCFRAEAAEARLQLGVRQTLSWFQRRLLPLFSAVLLLAHLPTRASAVVCEGHGFFGDPDSCTKFWVCSPDGATSFDCNPGLIWNEGAKRCDWPYNTVCGKEGESTEITTISSTTSTSTSSSTSSSSSSSSASSKATLTSSRATPSTRTQPRPPSTTASRKDQCKNRMDGFYPNWLKQCSEYFLCMGGQMTNRRKCSYGLVFDVYTAKCNKKNKVKPPCGTSNSMGTSESLGGGAASILGFVPGWLVLVPTFLVTSSHVVANL